MERNKNSVISTATARNWKKLNTSIDGRLTSRANKRFSKKRILPIEYFCNLDNVAFVLNILEKIDQSEWPISSVVLSLGINLLKRAGILNAEHVRTLLSEYQNIPLLTELEEMEIPSDEFDLPGIVYQSYLHEGDKNTIGSYYTPRIITQNMTQSFDFSNTQTFFDPCCGSGAFLLTVEAPNPELLFGADNDEIAVLIAKINLLVKYKKNVFYPNIVCMNYLLGSSRFSEIKVDEFYTKKFDYIATNPPWGAVSGIGRCTGSITSNESFSAFFVNAFKQLNENGIIRFLFPESVLNVKVHRDIRSFILHNTCLSGITVYEGLFTGVTTKFIDIECAKKKSLPTFIFRNQFGRRNVEISSIHETENLVFNPLNDMDLAILHKVKSKGRHSLQNSIWALGIVTGDNKNKLSSVKLRKMEPIFTGKEIARYYLKPAKNFILYDRKNFQQTAKDEIYRAPEKLAYKFISNTLVFAYDNTQSLFLNSANILIPKIQNMCTKTVMAFLNSVLFQFLYKIMFGEVKILRGNLEELPFPNISEDDNTRINEMVNDLLQGNSSKEIEIENAILDFYNLKEEQIVYIKNSVYGNTLQ